MPFPFLRIEVGNKQILAFENLQFIFEVRSNSNQCIGFVEFRLF